jgi:hypothetical protein
MNKTASMPLTINRIQTSSRRIRITKKRQFRDALLALDQLSRGSFVLPDDVCTKIWEMARDIESTRDRWIYNHRAAIIIPIWQQLELHFTEERTER